jgi:uncharacterized protein (TIGR04141 family)
VETQEPLRSLSIFLLKETVEGPRDAVRDAEALAWYDVRDLDGVVATQPTTPKTPWWVEYLAPHLAGAETLESLRNASTRALLILRAAERHFAFAFGQGRHLLDADSYEQDFGLRVVLNTVDADQLKSVDSRTFDELTLHTRRDLSQGSSLSAFGLDVTRDLLRAVTGPPRDPAVGHRASGADALALLTRAQLDQLPALCERLLAAYGADDYKERFGWIDQLRRVRDPELVERLNEHLVERIRNEELVDIHLAPPEPMPWDRLEGFTYSRRRDEPLDPDPRITSYLEGVRSIDELDVKKLKRDRVMAISSETQLPLEAWQVYRCVVYEAREDDLLYALVAGHWYEVSASFADEVMRFAESLPELELPMPDAAEAIREDEYNRQAAEALGALNMDTELVRTPTGDRIELCDLLARERKLLHVKKRGSSSTLSHLFSQGVVSAELLAREEAFRTAVRSKVAELDGDFAELVPDSRPERDSWEVSFVVLTRSKRETPLTLPFFSLVNLRSAVLRLQDLGYRVSVRQVKEAMSGGGSEASADC